MKPAPDEKNPEAQAALAAIEAWIDVNPDEHRVTVQRSIDRKGWLVRLEVGDHGHGEAKWYGKGERLDGCLMVAIAATALDGGPR